MFYGGIKAGGQGYDCACAAQANVVSAIRTESAATGIETFNPASIANNTPILVDNALVINKRAPQLTVQFKGKQCAESAPINTGRTCDEQGRRLLYSRRRNDCCFADPVD